MVSLLLQYSLVVTLVDAYSDFATLGKAVLQMFAESKGVDVASADADRILEKMRSLPPHPEVRGAWADYARRDFAWLL